MAARDADELAWYENTDGAGSFGSKQVITTLADNAQFVAAGDIDDDGDLECIPSAEVGHSVALI